MDTTTASPSQTPSALIDITGDEVSIAALTFSSPVVAGHLASLPEDKRAAELIRAIEIGVHGLTATTMQATVDEMQQQVRRIISAAAEAAETHLGSAVEAGRSELAAHLDPEVRTSLTARAAAELEEVHQATLARLDPDRTDSHTARLIDAISELLGPGGMLAQRLADVFESAEADHGLGRLLDTFERRFQEMRDLLIGEQHRREEADRGTAKGVEFEDLLEDVLRTEARSISGCVVERTGQMSGTLGSHAKVGDFTVLLPDGTRVAIEAKNTARIGLTGTGGILTELDNAMDNRKATWAICVSRTDAYPAEVGSFGVYGRRLLIVDPGDGTLTRVALRWISAAARSVDTDRNQVDTAEAFEKLERIRGLAQHFSRSKKILASAQSGLDTVRDELDTLRTELLDLVGEAHRSLQPPASVARQVA